MNKHPHISALILSLAALAAPALAQDYDFQWATIGDVNNPAYGGGPFGELAGRGSVSYAYRISRLEITTAQWMEFVNTFSTQSDDLRRFADPLHWGARVDTSYTGPGRRWRLEDHPDAANRPVTGITWREAAQFCNWLHNGKSADLSALATGAYDTSTFGDGPGRTFTDHHHHLPGARFWIPTLDEWLKAAHYDPDRHGPGQGGWWAYSNSSDEAPIPGLPGEGETMAGIDLVNFAHWDVPLGAYPHVQSPWGLLDLSGGAAELLEEGYFPGLPQERGVDGSWAGHGGTGIDVAWGSSSLRPGSFGSGIGLRIASIPAPASGAVLVAVVTVLMNRRKRGEICHG